MERIEIYALNFDGLSSKKIMISFEQIHASWNALHFDDILSIVCSTITSPFQNIRSWKTKSNTLIVDFSIWLWQNDQVNTELSYYQTILSIYLVSLEKKLAVFFDYYIYQQDIIKTSTYQHLIVSTFLLNPLQIMQLKKWNME